MCVFTCNLITSRNLCSEKLEEGAILREMSNSFPFTILQKLLLKAWAHVQSITGQTESGVNLFLVLYAHGWFWFISAVW